MEILGFLRGNWLQKYCKILVEASKKQIEKLFAATIFFHLSLSNWIASLCGFGVQHSDDVERFKSEVHINCSAQSPHNKP